RSRTSFSAREISAELGMDAAARATSVDSAIRGWGFEMEPPRKGLRGTRKPALAPVRLGEGWGPPGRADPYFFPFQSGYSTIRANCRAEMPSSIWHPCPA